jgi:hypothetical protein
VLLVSGGIIGSGLTFLVVVRQAQFRMQHPEAFAGNAAARLQRYLELSDEQKLQVESILREHQKGVQAIRRDCQPRFEQKVEDIRRDVSAVLTPAQSRKWEAWLDDKRRLWLPPLPPAEPASQQAGPAQTAPG